MNLTDVLCVRALKEDVVVTCLRIVLANIFSLWSFQIFETLFFASTQKISKQEIISTIESWERELQSSSSLRSQQREIQKKERLRSVNHNRNGKKKKVVSRDVFYIEYESIINSTTILEKDREMSFQKTFRNVREERQ